MSIRREALGGIGIGGLSWDSMTAKMRINISLHRKYAVTDEGFKELERQAIFMNQHGAQCNGKRAHLCELCKRVVRRLGFTIVLEVSWARQ